MTIESSELLRYQDFACDVAKQAGHKTLEYFRKPLHVEGKRADSFDPVTEADRAAERFIRERIGETWPAHGIRGEEFGDVEGERWKWVIDPIDGTRAFISGLLHWGVLLALCEYDRALLGVMYQPFTNELFFGSNLGSTYQRGEDERLLTTKECEHLSDATLLTTSPRLFASTLETKVLERFETTVRLTRFGGDCYQYAMLSMGMVDLVVETALKPWDIQALIPIVEGAGGTITKWDGGDPNQGGNIVAACNSSLHAKAIELIQGADIEFFGFESFML